MSYNGYGSIGGLDAGSPFSSPTYLNNSYGAAYGAYGGSRDVSGAGGYKYRQYDDGRIKILSGPSGVGSTLSSGSAWNAITNEIGPYPASSSSSGGGALTVDLHKNRTKRTDREEEPSFWEGAFDKIDSVFDKVKDAYVTPNILQGSGLDGSGSVAAPPEKTVPWGWIIGGTIGVGALITIAVMASKRGK